MFRKKLLALILTTLVLNGFLHAQETAAPGSGTPKDSSAPSLSLAEQQDLINHRIAQLEELLLRRAELEITEHPERAALLRRAVKHSRENFILDRLVTSSKALRDLQFQRAIDNQSDGNEQLQAILKLLLTENRSERIREEKKRIANWIKALKRTERKQRATRARSENGADLQSIIRDQQDLAEQSQKLAKQMSPQKATSKASSSSPKSNKRDPRSKTKPPSEPSTKKNGQQSESQGSKSQGSKSQGSKSQGSKSQGSKSQGSKSQGSKSQGSKSQGSKSSPKSGSSKPSQSSQPSSSPKSPQQQAEQAVQKAVENMKQAQQALQKQRRDKATAEQRQAEQNLREAIERLERILRQRREEELKRQLTRLESRLRKIAHMQTDVLEDTRLLAAVSKADRDRRTDLQAGRLSDEERKIILETDRAMTLLQEEGSSVAFPEVIRQVREDMLAVADRLSQSQIDSITQGIQEDILVVLEDMIAALQKAQRDLEQKQRERQQNQKESSPPSGDPPLLESLAELKLIRTMQKRVKIATKRYAKLSDALNEPDDGLAKLQNNLANRQKKLSNVTRDLVLKRNQ